MDAGRTCRAAGGTAHTRRGVSSATTPHSMLRVWAWGGRLGWLGLPMHSELRPPRDPQPWAHEASQRPEKQRAAAGDVGRAVQSVETMPRAPRPRLWHAEAVSVLGDVLRPESNIWLWRAQSSHPTAIRHGGRPWACVGWVRCRKRGFGVSGGTRVGDMMI